MSVHNSSTILPTDIYLPVVNHWKIINPKYWCNKTSIPHLRSIFSNNTVQLIVLGLLTILANIFVLFVIISANKKLRSKSAFIISLAMGNLCNGLVLSGYVLGRLIKQYYQMDCETLSIFDCVQQILPILTLFAWQAPAITLLLAGFERFLVAGFSRWRNLNWKKYSRRAVVLTYVYIILIQMPILIFYTWFHRDFRSFYTCDWLFLVDIKYTIYIHFTVIICGTFSSVLTVISLILTLKRLKSYDRRKDAPSELNVNSEMRKRIVEHLQFTKCTFAVCLFDFSLVVIPNILLFTIDMGKYDLLLSAGWPAIYCYSANSIPHPFIYVYFNKMFRTAISKKLNKFKHQTAIAPITIKVAAHKPPIGK